MGFDARHTCVAAAVSAGSSGPTRFSILVTKAFGIAGLAHMHLFDHNPATSPSRFDGRICSCGSPGNAATRGGTSTDHSRVDVSFHSVVGSVYVVEYTSYNADSYAPELVKAIFSAIQKTLHE